MATPKPFPPAKLVCGIISSEDRFFEYAEQGLQGLFGPIDARSFRAEFEITGYYEKQMGSGLQRMFVSFERLVPPEDLSSIKLRTNALEEETQRHFRSEKRIVNLDPGTLTAAALIMATAKDFSHRVPLQQGIYAHLELLFNKNGTQTLPWTYPDLRGDRYGSFFLDVRKAFMLQDGSKPSSRDRRS